MISSQFLVLFLLSLGGENERREIARAHLFFVSGRVPPTSESSRRYTLALKKKKKKKKTRNSSPVLKTQNEREKKIRKR